MKRKTATQSEPSFTNGKRPRRDFAQQTQAPSLGASELVGQDSSPESLPDLLQTPAHDKD